MTNAPPAPLVDLHSHLVPGVDDGARSVEDALEGVSRMVAAGIRRIVTTPHLAASLTLDRDALEARLQRFDSAWSRVSEAVRRRAAGVEFRRGHEVMLDVPDADLSDARLRLGGTRFALVEWPSLQVPPESARALASLVAAGIRPLVAHPERYRGIGERLDLVAAWKEAGAYLQVNHGSLTGRYGGRVRAVALRLVRLGWADCLSSDFHGRPHLDLHLEECRRVVERAGGSVQWDLLAAVNPGRMLDDLDPVAVPPLEVDRGVLGRLRSFLGGGEVTP